ncbi:hypothetical protein NIES30_13960 [Phormidium tenue NIES-30]|uniref:Uncharacterized protein n=1 Tax=Phormidium tenue NIES-30 TaxID=549789 RepID=A0A1U7J3Z2_9CYAN|nr:hypothetical protein NIES30_13960 [Phormidium tenue NIES-30]
MCQFNEHRAVFNDQRVMIAKQLCQFAKQLCQFNDHRAVFNDHRALIVKQLCQFAFSDRVPVVLTQDVASNSRHSVSLGAATQ